MSWQIILAGAVALLLILSRIYSKLRNVQRAQVGSWDARMIERLRSHGYVPFNDYKVDFFLALPDETACQGVRAQLESRGFSVDVKPMENDSELAYSLHASKMMRLIVPDMQELSRSMTLLADQFRGRYDGWAV
jgi:hypothetical protein